MDEALVPVGSEAAAPGFVSCVVKIKGREGTEAARTVGSRQRRGKKPGRLFGKIWLLRGV